MADTNTETHAAVIAAMREIHVAEFQDFAKRMDAAYRREAQSIERIVRDAIISYTEQYVNAPNDETEREIQHRAEVANEWLRQHGFAEEPTYWSKEEIPCL